MLLKNLGYKDLIGTQLSSWDPENNIIFVHKNWNMYKISWKQNQWQILPLCCRDTDYKLPPRFKKKNRIQAIKLNTNKSVAFELVLHDGILTCFNYDKTYFWPFFSKKDKEIVVEEEEARVIEEEEEVVIEEEVVTEEDGAIEEEEEGIIEKE